MSRTFLPSAYKIKNYNNGIIRGTAALSADSVLAYGVCGVWLTDRNFAKMRDFNRGLPEGVDGRNIKNIVITSAGETWCAAQFGLYRLSRSGWIEVPLPGNSERLADVTLTEDSTGVVAVTRSELYKIAPGAAPARVELRGAEGHDRRVSLFKTVWNLHSGALFGLPGKIVADLVALILILLSVTGIVLFILPYSIRRRARRRLGVLRMTRFFKSNFRWHNSVGYFTLVLTVLIVFTGMCLRPPLMIPFVMSKSAPLPGSTLDSDNPWQDKLRALRHDSSGGYWLLSTSDGFYKIRDFADVPRAIPADKTPAISPMGINVFHRERPGEWIIGSFSGLCRWEPASGTCRDYYTGKRIERGGRASFGPGSRLVSGYTADTPVPVVFDYAKGAEGLPPMPKLLAEQSMSLWNFALELHVGRCYSPFLGPVSDMFVFLAGLIILLILISGYLLNRRLKVQPLRRNS